MRFSVCCSSENIFIMLQVTNMETVNLAVVFSPNCIQSPNPDPQLFASNANYERKCFKLFIDVLCPE